MKFSIITPIHKTNPYLVELYDSIVAQTYSNWEWVLYLNSEMSRSKLPNQIREDDRVVVYEDYSSDGFYDRGGNKSGGKIGYYKHHAFFKGTGDVLVEVDYDDLLTPDCLEELNIAYQDEEVGFVYSDVTYWKEGEDYEEWFNSDYGWGQKHEEFRGNKTITHVNFPPSSVTYGHIWFQPDHIRSWRKTLYYELGGHNVELPYLDDQELMIRTYLSNTKIKEIPKTLYIYRLTDSQATDQTRDEMQYKCVDIFHQYAFDLALKDCEKRNLLAVDLGGGHWQVEGLLNIDQSDSADIKCDLNEGIPLEDNTCGLINASHIIEHLYDPFKTMSEIHRVLAHGGWAFIEVPSTDGRGAFQDPTHVSFWNENSFWYYTQQSKAQFIGNDKVRFMTKRLETGHYGEFNEQNNILNTIAWLVAVKDDDNRLPGLLEI